MLRALVAAIVVASCVAATAREFPVVPQPIILELRGRLAPDRNAARAQSPDVVGLQIGDDTRWMAVDRAVTLRDHPLSGRAVLDMLAPFQTSVSVAGATDLRDRLARAPVDTPVTIEGLLDRGSRTLLLREVQAGEPRSP
jgi:hypothetical protein